MPYSLSATNIFYSYPQVTCWPDITVHKRDSTDDVLILACDGVWDVMSSAEAVGLVREIFLSGETNMQLVAEELVDITLNKGQCIFCILSQNILLCMHMTY